MTECNIGNVPTAKEPGPGLMLHAPVPSVPPMRGPAEGKVLSESKLFKRRLATAFVCMVASLGLIVWALVSRQVLWFMPAAFLLMGAWLLVLVAADSGSFSTNSDVRREAERINQWTMR